MDKTPLLAQRLRWLRRCAGYTQAELGRRAGLTKACVQALELGARTNPGLTTVVALARALGVPIDWLASGCGCHGRCPPGAPRAA